MCHFPPQNTSIFPEQNFLIQTIITNYFKKKNFKNLTADPEFLPKNGPFAPQKMFLESYQYHSHLSINPFQCVKL